MQRTVFWTVSLLSLVFTASCSTPSREARDSEDNMPEKIIGIERSALDRWSNGDPQGYFEAYAADVTYFDPYQERRIDGLGAMKELFTPITGKFKIDRYEMINPKVQHHGNVAVLTYNLVNYSKQPDGTEKIINRWNNTEVFRWIDGNWKIIHSHWSLTRPELKQTS